MHKDIKKSATYSTATYQKTGGRGSVVGFGECKSRAEGDGGIRAHDKQSKI